MKGAVTEKTRLGEESCLLAGSITSGSVRFP